MWRNNVNRVKTVRLARWVVGCLFALTLTACGRDEAPREAVKPAAAPVTTFRVLAGSEIKDLDAMRPAMEKAAAAKIEFVYSGSLDAVERLEAGEAFDAVWLSHGKYLQQTPALKPRIRATERIMASPVVLGLKASKAAQLGWDKADPTWAEIVKAANAGKFTYGMTNPASSNSGFTALVGVAAALADKQDALTVADIKTRELRGLFAGQKLTAGSSGWLADAYLREQARIDGMINYESVILALNQQGALKEKLVPIYPRDGIVTADYPLMLLDDSRRTAFDGLVKFLRSPEAQREITNTTLRRPVAGDIPPAAAIPKRVLAELPFPASRDVLDQLIEAYQGELRRPASTYFVIDVSGSMQGDGITQLRASIQALAGADTSATGRFARFQTRERVYFLPFNGKPLEPVRYEFPPGRSEAGALLAQVQQWGQALEAKGGTAIFSSTKVALEAAIADRKKAPDRQYTVVVMTDGRNESGMNESEFAQWYEALPEDDQGIKVFGVLFGRAEKTQLERIAELTGGRVFDARKSLAVAFKEIRGYQ
jgi:Ca-activated chloride channel homolog